MLLYRAVSNDDIKNINNGKGICSSLNYTYVNADTEEKINRIRNLRIYNDLCFCQERKYALDCITGHVSGKRLGVRKSPWISTSASFDKTVIEYSLPKSGKYNSDMTRKPIYVLDIPDDRIFSSIEDVTNLRETREDNFAIDLRNDNLEILYKANAIEPECNNENMPGFINGYKKASTKSIKGFSNYSTYSEEVLVFNKINDKYVKAILSPGLVDVLYACNINIEENYDFIMNNYVELNSLISGYIILNVDLFCYVKNVLVLLDGNIDDKYNYLKDLKKQTILNIVNEINEKFNKDLKVERLVDDNILIKSYNNLDEVKNLNSLLAIEKDKNIYLYDHELNEYYCNEIDDAITKKEVLDKIKKSKAKAKIKER